MRFSSLDPDLSPDTPIRLVDQPDLLDRLPQDAKEIQSRFARIGQPVYIVGGAVRDFLLELTPGDIDFATPLEPEQIQSLFSDCPQVLTGLKHGTVGIVWNHTLYEITTFRRDSAYSDLRHPDAVVFTQSLAQDLARRDFTVNALALDASGTVHDYTGGLDDLQNRIIRTVGKAQTRFSEDALRILRAYRFCATYGFTIEEATHEVACRLMPNLQFIAGERIGAEFRRLLTGKYFLQQLPIQKDILSYLFPKSAQRRAGDWSDLADLALPPDYVLRLAAVIRPAQEPEIQELGNLLKLSKSEYKRLQNLVPTLSLRPEPTPSELILFQNKYRIDLEDWLCFLPSDSDYTLRVHQAHADCLKKQLPLTLQDLAVTGEDLLNLGLPSGPFIGQTLESLWLAVLEERIPNETSALQAMAQRQSPPSGPETN